MISRELPSSAVTGLSVFGSARWEITSLPPRRPISVLSPAHTWLSAELASSVLNTVAAIRDRAGDPATFAVFVTKLNSTRFKPYLIDCLSSRVPC